MHNIPPRHKHLRCLVISVALVHEAEHWWNLQYEGTLSACVHKHWSAILLSLLYTCEGLSLSPGMVSARAPVLDTNVKSVYEGRHTIY